MRGIHAVVAQRTGTKTLSLVEVFTIDARSAFYSSGVVAADLAAGVEVGARQAGSVGGIVGHDGRVEGAAVDEAALTGCIK